LGGEVNGHKIGRLLAKACHPYTFRVAISPDANRTQTSMAAVSADGRTV